MTPIEIFARRLKNARIMNRLSMEQLCQKMNGLVQKAAISKYENARMMPSDEVRQALAVALGVSEDYFFRPLVATADTFQIDFRKKSSMKATDVNALVEKCRDKVERYLEVDQILRNANADHQTLPRPVVVATRQDAVEVAQKLRGEWLMGRFPIVNVQQLLERHGVKMIPVEEEDNFDGLSGSIEQGGQMHHFVVCNSKKSHIERRRFTLMHELGHLVMKPADDVQPRDFEGLCHAFASEMLLPTVAVHTFMRQMSDTSVLALRSLQAEYGISIDAIMRKIFDLNYISQFTYTTYFKMKNMNQTFKTTVDRSVFQEMPLYDCYASRVLKALSMHLIERERAESLLYDYPDLIQDIHII